MRISVLLAVLGLLLLSGCVTQRDKEAVVRGAKFAAQTGGDLGQAVSEELGQVALDIGAVKVDDKGQIIPGDVDPTAVEVTVEAASSNAKGIASDRQSREKVTGFLGNFGRELLNRLPWGSTAVAAMGAAWALLRKRTIQAALTGMVQAGMEIREKAAAGVPLGEAAVKGVLSFWSSASGAKKDVEAALDRIKPMWQEPAKDTPAKV